MQLKAKHMIKILGVRTQMVSGRKLLERGYLVENWANYQHGLSTLIKFAR